MGWFRPREGDVVHAHPGPDDELQLPAPGGVDLGLFDFGGGADDDGVEVPQGGAQGVRLVELFRHLVPVLPELRHGGGVHAVGDQYAL